MGEGGGSLYVYRKISIWWLKQRSSRCQATVRRREVTNVHTGTLSPLPPLTCDYACTPASCSENLGCTLMSPGEHQHVLLIFFNLSLTCRHVTSFSLQSATTDSLFVLRTILLFGERSLRVAAPGRAWNQLPRDVRCVDNINTSKKKNWKFLVFFVNLLFCCLYWITFAV